MAPARARANIRAMFAAVLALEVLALVGGKVHPMVDGAQPLEATILVEGDRILAVGADLPIPEGARRVELHGMHVIPGLIDGYAFHDPEHELLYTAAGVTLVCDHGNDMGRIFAARERGARDAALGPALFIAGGVVDGLPPATDMAITVRSPEEAKGAVERLAEERVDFVAYQPHLTLEAWKQLCATAKDKQLAVWGPRLREAALEEIAAAGQRGIVGIDSLTPRGKSLEETALAEVDPLLELLAKAHVALVPTLRAYASLLEDPGDAAPESAELGPQYATFWQRELAQRRTELTDEGRRRLGGVLGKQRQLLALLQRAGCELVPGSGAPHPWLMPGAGLARELAEWQAVGIPAGECLAYATVRAARAFGVDKERGTLEAGKLADLVVLRADPAQDVAALREVEAVVLRGQLLERATLDKRLAERRGALDEAKRRLAAPIEVDPPELPEGTVLLSGRVETESSAGKLAAERWAIVREVDGTLTFCGRRRLLGPDGNDRFVAVRQRVRKGALESFDVKVSTQKSELALKGQQVAGAWRVERRANGQFIDIKGARESLAAVDCGSVTTYLLLAHTREAGHFPVARLYEGVELEVVRWDLALDDDGDHKFATPAGWRFAGFEENGALKAVVEQVGQGFEQTTSMEVDAHGGPGLPPPESKLALMRKAREAGAPADGAKK